MNRPFENIKITMTLDATADPLEPHPASVKICGECDGRGFHSSGQSAFIRVCKACQGSRRYGYLANGDRVAFNAGKDAWVKT